MPLRDYDVYWAPDPGQLSRANRTAIQVEDSLAGGAARPAKDIAEDAVRQLAGQRWDSNSPLRAGRYLVIRRGAGTVVTAKPSGDYEIKAES